MAINTQTIRIDLNTGRTIPVAFAHQNDTNRQLTFQLYNNGVAFTPSSTTVKFAYKSPIVNGQYSVITGSEMATGTVSGSTVTVTLPAKYTQVSGVGLLTMILTTSGNTLRPVNIKFVCQGSADGDDTILAASDWPEGLYDYMDNWLEENEPTEIANLKSDINNRLQLYDDGVLSVGLDFTTSYGFIGGTGAELNNHENGQRKTSFIDVSNTPSITITTRYTEPVTAWVAVATYDSNQTFIARIGIVNSVANKTETSNNYEIPSGVSYVRVMFSSFDIGVLNVYCSQPSKTYEKLREFYNYYENLNYKRTSGVNEVTPILDETSCISKPIPITWTGNTRFDSGRVGNDFTFAIYDSSDSLLAWFGLSGGNSSQYRDITLSNYPTAKYVTFSYDKDVGGKVIALSTNETVWSPQKLDYSIKEDVEKNTEGIYNLNTCTQILGNENTNFQTDNFAIGGLYHGFPSSITYRVSSVKPYVFPFPISLTADSGFRFGVHSYDESGAFVADSGWQTAYIVPANTPFNFVIAKVTEDTSSTADIPTFVNAIVVNVSEYSAGTSLYSGDKIVLNNDNTTQHGVNITLWKDFVGAEISNLSGYSLHLNQSMTIYGGYVFLFSPNGLCTILDYSTKSIVGTCNFTPTDYQHANSAQFTDMYYASGDEFPLLLLSRCGNSASGSGHDECLIYRITRSGSAFTMTLINDMKPSFATYGASWGIDNNTGLLYMSTTINGTWQVTENNPIMFSAYKMPPLSEILSGNEITISEDDMIAKMLIPHYTLQGMAVNGGIIYTGITIQGVGHNVWAADIWNNRVKSKIKLTSYYEVEGVAVYDGKIYVSQKSGTDTEAVNPCKIYELSFDV